MSKTKILLKQKVEETLGSWRAFMERFYKDKFDLRDKIFLKKYGLTRMHIKDIMKTRINNNK